jgi:hypothetical protein
MNEQTHLIGTATSICVVCELNAEKLLLLGRCPGLFGKKFALGITPPPTPPPLEALPEPRSPTFTPNKVGTGELVIDLVGTRNDACCCCCCNRPRCINDGDGDGVNVGRKGDGIGLEVDGDVGEGVNFSCGGGGGSIENEIGTGPTASLNSTSKDP